MHGKVTKRVLSMLLAACMLVPGINVAAKESKETDVGKKYVETENNRIQLNFNRDWKFYRGDVENAQQPEFDDSEWTDVALPHNFSVPYNMESSFYVGYGWYRKDFEVPENWNGKRINIEFEGVFQVAEIYVNGEAVATHEGGYTGFEYDITDYVHTGNNQISVRVNNIWQPDLSPRAGDHQFTGGIYRDVYLNVTDDVHVTWYGTFVTTPDLTNPGFDQSAVNVLDSYTSESEIKENLAKKQSNVNVQTEVKNDSTTAKKVQVKQQVVDEENKIVAEFSSKEQVIPAGEIYNFDDTSEKIKDIKIWDTENPYVYKVYTTVYADGEKADVYESPLGFRWAQYKNDGFYLNGEKTLLDGANAHQDHGGWADAVTNKGFYRDVQMIKEAGMNFIRGSHYPHDPSYAEACDELGILFWSESVFWGMGGCGGKDEPATMTANDWFKDAYPQNPEDEKAFEESCKQALTDMIRINRNHPSIINWSMGNEVFFTAAGTQQKAKNLVNEMRNLSHKLDPTRKAGMGGVQREGYDKIEVCDIAGYNGDGGKFENLKMPNIVAEYGSKTADRPGQYRPFYDQIAKPGTTDEYQLKQNSAGLSLWCAFHHGTIGGHGLAKMGVVDYYRVPLNSWYWYREKNTGVAPEQSIDGKAAQMELTASQKILNNNGTDDTHIIVTMKDKDGNWVNQTQKITLKVVSGPGVFPTGKEYTFVPNKTIYDGKAAIEFRSYYSGETVIRATSSGLPDAELHLTTVNTSGEAEGNEPEGFYVTEEKDTTEKIEEPMLYGTSNVASGRPAFPSSNDADRALAVDGNMETSWTAEKTGSGEYWMTDLEFAQYLYKVKLGFSGAPYPYKIEVAMDKENGPWRVVADYTKDTVAKRPYEESVDGIEARYVKITFTDVPEDEKAFLSECEVYGVTSSQSPQYAAESVYLSDLEWESVKTGWKEPGKDVSCEGNPIRLGGKQYDKGLGLHADSEVVYKLDGKYSRFQAVAGIDDEVGSNVGDAVFQVVADGKIIYEENLLTGDSDIVDLSVSGVRQLKLITTQNGADSNDHTDWADAKVLGAIRDTSIKDSGYKVDFTSNTQEFTAGGKFDVRIGLHNVESEQTDYTAAITLYNKEGVLIDTEQVSDYLSKGEKIGAYLSMDIPEYAEEYMLHVNVWNTSSLEKIAQTTYVSGRAKSTEEPPEETENWIKVDGEKMQKVGNWKLWPSNQAYENTETYTGDTDTPLTDQTSISYRFTGTKVRVGAKVDRGQTGAKVFIDDKEVGKIVNRAEEEINEYRQVYESDNLTEGEHTIKLVPEGKFGIDYIEYLLEEKPTEPEDPQKEPERVRPELKDAFQKYYGVIETESVSKYTLDSRKSVADAAAKAYFVLKDSTAQESDWKAEAQKLEQALQNLTVGEEVPKVDKSQLGQLLETANAKQESEYTKESWETFQAALETANNVYADEKATQEAVNQAYHDLKSAMDKLVPKEETEPTVDKSDLEALIAYAESQKNKEEYKDVLPVVKAAFEKSLEEAKAVMGDVKAEQAAVDAAYEALLANVHLLGFTGNTDDLELALELAKTTNTEGKTPESVKVLQDSIAKAEKILADGNVLQEEIDAARDALLAAIDGLEDIVLADKTKLKTLLENSQKYVDRIDEYTKATADAFMAAREAAQSVYDNLEATQEQVNAAYDTLRQAIFGLRLIPDKSKLEELLQKAEGLDVSKYTEETMAQVAKAFAYAQAVYANENATETDVKEAEELLVAAMDGLKEKEAASASKTPEQDSNKDGNKAAKTGDASTVIFLVMLLFAASVIMVKRKTA